MVATIVGIGATPAFGSQTYSISPSSGPAGTNITVSGSGCPGGAAVEFEMFRQTGTVITPGDNIAFATFTATADGAFTGQATVSAGDVGIHQTSVRCANNRVVDHPFTLTASPVTTTTTTTTTVAPVTTVATTTTTATTIAPVTTRATTSTTNTTTTTRLPPQVTTAIDRVQALVQSLNLPPEVQAVITFLLHWLLYPLG